MRVAMLLDNHYAPDPRVAFESELLANAGADVSIVAWDRREDGDETADVDGIEVKRIRVPAPRGGGRKTAQKMLEFSQRVWRSRRSLLADVDVLVVHDIYLLALGRFLARSLRIPFIYDAHEEYAAMEGWRYPERVLRLVEGRETSLARHAYAIVVPGETRISRWTAVGLDAPIVVRNLGSHRTAAERKGRLRWDLVYAGTIDAVRRIDLLIALAKSRPDLRIAVAGAGRGVPEVEAAAATLPNLDFVGWVAAPEDLVDDGATLYYGLDPRHPYASKACPNTLYTALRRRRPLLFFCGGEPEALLARFSFGIQCEATVDALGRAVDAAKENERWEFDAAWRAVSDPAPLTRYVDAVLEAAGGAQQRSAA